MSNNDNQTDFIDELEKRLKEYELLIYENKKLGLMKENTVTTYLTHSTNFVRWCKGEFKPGDRNRTI